MVRDSAPLRFRGLVGGDVEAAVELARVEVDDFASGDESELDGEGTLAGSGRAGDGDDERRQWRDRDWSCQRSLSRSSCRAAFWWSLQ